MIFLNAVHFYLWLQIDVSEYGNVDFNGGSLLNGNSKVLYWADGFSEMFFMLPSDNNSRVSESRMEKLNTFYFLRLH